MLFFFEAYFDEQADWNMLKIIFAHPKFGFRFLLKKAFFFVQTWIESNRKQIYRKW